MAIRKSRISPNPSQAIPRHSFKYLVSACLAGEDCTYNGKDKLNRAVREMVRRGSAFPMCPEVLGGAAIPRERCEIIGGSGADVLKKNSLVLTLSGRDVSDILVSGAKKTLRLAKRLKIKKAILKSKSPSCGSGLIYDGTFTGSLRRGDGVAAALLRLNGISVYTEKHVHEE